MLSADTMVWPSIFETVVIPEKRSGLRQPDWIGMNVPFWRDLDALGKAIVEQKSDLGRPFRFVAATWHTDLGFEQEAKQEGKFLGPYLDATLPEVRNPAWQFLGFDITDGGFISGLSNCGYGNERAALAAEWERDLNPNHLFNDLRRAFQFRNLTNARVPEHAPFFVIGLWSIAPSTPDRGIVR